MKGFLSLLSRFEGKRVLIKSATFSISITSRIIFTKLLAISESSI